LTPELKKKIGAAYLTLGIIDLFTSGLIGLGMAFSSFGYSLLAFALVVVPVGLGLLAFFRPHRVYPGLMLFGCGVTLIYICWCTVGNLRSGQPPLVFHVIWALLTFALGYLALLSYKSAIRSKE